jgi:uncharacterized NAD(P)/FAD-binding protein YdhS
MSFTFAIIGAGLTGTAMFCQFLQKLQDMADVTLNAEEKAEILIFEQQDVFGPGFPHGDRFVMPYHITNMCDYDMSILAGKPDDFQQWVNANPDILEAYMHQADAVISQSAGLPDRCRHYPRAVMGEYLKARFRETLRRARDLNIRVRRYPGVEVTDLKAEGSRVEIHARRLQSGETFSRAANRVLLATGHWFEKSDRKNYYTSPWPASELLRGIPAGEHVGVIGTSLSAIEAALTLTSDGRFQYADSGELIFLPSRFSRTVALYSRRGMLPKVRGRCGSYRNRHLTLKKLEEYRPAGSERITLEHLFQLLNADLESAYGRPFNWEAIIHPCGSPADQLQTSLNQARSGDGPNGELIWQTVLHQSFPMARALFLSLTPEDRERFEREFATLFFMHAATQPAINAEKMLALMKSGIVTVHKLGSDYRFFKDEARDLFELSYRDASGKQKQDAYRYIVNARGQPQAIETNPSRLVQNLLKSQTIRIDERSTVNPPDLPGNHLIQTPDSQNRGYRPGSARIDPVSHRIMTTGPDGAAIRSPCIYAVGAMTRGQIIDASMAYGIALSTAVIAEEWTQSLFSLKPC